MRITASFFQGAGEACVLGRAAPSNRETERTGLDASYGKWLSGDVPHLSADQFGPCDFLPLPEEGHGPGTPLGTRGEHVLWHLGKQGGGVGKRSRPAL